MTVTKMTMRRKRIGWNAIRNGVGWRGRTRCRAQSMNVELHTGVERNGAAQGSAEHGLQRSTVQPSAAQRQGDKLARYDRMGEDTLNCAVMSQNAQRRRRADRQANSQVRVEKTSQNY